LALTVLAPAATPLPADKKLTVSVLGASISAGIGAEDAPAWVDRLEQYLKDTYGKVAGVNVTVNNGAVPGTTSAYMAACVNLHVPRDADIVVVEYSVNDDWQVYPPLDNPVR
jgi:DNA polymerase alpha subunit B